MGEHRRLTIEARADAAEAKRFLLYCPHPTTNCLHCGKALHVREGVLELCNKPHLTRMPYSDACVCSHRCAALGDPYVD